MITFADGLPRAMLTKRSIDAARVYGSPPGIRALDSPDGAGGPLPTRTTWTWLGRALPVGWTRLRAVWVTAGSDPPLVSRIAAWIGAAASADAAIPPCQSPESTSATAGGRVCGLVEGNAAPATPAASAVGSLPATRVVFFVAVVGNPSWFAAFLSPDLAPPAGGADGAPPDDWVTEQAVRASAARAAHTSAVRGTGR